VGVGRSLCSVNAYYLLLVLTCTCRCRADEADALNAPIFTFQSINQSMAVTDAGTNVPLYPYHTFYILLIFKST